MGLLSPESEPNSVHVGECKMHPVIDLDISPTFLGATSLLPHFELWARLVTVRRAVFGIASFHGIWRYGCGFHLGGVEAVESRSEEPIERSAGELQQPGLTG